MGATGGRADGTRTALRFAVRLADVSMMVTFALFWYVHQCGEPPVCAFVSDGGIRFESVFCSG